MVVGSLPTTNGKTATAQYGCLIVLDSQGKAVKTIAGKNIQGPWDSTAKSEGAKTTLFVSNALNGGAAKGVKPIDNSTVVRIDLESGEGQEPKVTSEQVVDEGIPWVNSAEALVLGPTGLALGSRRHAVRGIHRRTTRSSRSPSRDTHSPARERRHGPQRRRPSQGTARDGAGAERQHHHHQRRRREHGRNPPCRQAGGRSDRGQEDRRRDRCSGWSSPPAAKASTTSTTAKTRSICSPQANRPPRLPRPRRAAERQRQPAPVDRQDRAGSRAT